MITTLNEYRQSINNSLIGYHGGLIEGPLRGPLFISLDKDEALDFAYHHKDANGGNLYEIEFKVNNPYKMFNKENSLAFVELIRRAGLDITIETHPNGGWNVSEKDMEYIRAHSPYYGDNLNDWVYVPEVRKQLLNEGYDSINSLDAVGPYEIEIYILLQPENQAKIINTIVSPQPN